MKDSKGTLIQAGQKLRRVIDGRATTIGHEYTVEERIWHEGDTEPSLVANGGFITELLYEERAKEFEVVQ